MNSDGYVDTQFTDNESDNNSDSMSSKNNSDNTIDDTSTHFYGNNMKKSKSENDMYENTSVNQELLRKNFVLHSPTSVESVSTNVDKETQIDKNFLDSTSNSIFVICKDGIPFTYCNSKDQASKYILDSVWNEKSRQLLRDSDYNYNIVIEEPSLIYLCSSYKNWFISYDNILCEFSYHEINYLNK